MPKKNHGLTFYRRENKKNKKVLKVILSYAFWTLAMALLAFVLVFCFGIRTSVVGVSMEPTLYNGEAIYINRFIYFFSAPKQNEVVVFLPNGNSNSHYYVKRVIGVPGDTVLIQNGLIYINDLVYEEEGNYDRIEDGGIAENPIYLDEDEYFVLGDNRNNSEDSRSSNVGIVKREYIIGRAWLHSSYNKEPLGFIK